jgi:hypothetical protein
MKYNGFEQVVFLKINKLYLEMEFHQMIYNKVFSEIATFYQRYLEWQTISNQFRNFLSEKKLILTVFIVYCLFLEVYKKKYVLMIIFLLIKKMN